jgi:hypothetical protein
VKVKLTTDWHIASKRVAGTTPASNQALQQYLLDSFKAALDPSLPHLICGDLFNEFTIDAGNLIATYEILSKFLSTGQRLAVLRGNHDHHPRGAQVSSFDLLMSILESQYPDNLTVAREVTEWHQFILVPHLPNNEILKIEVEKLAGVKGKVVVFHANYDNFHAADTEHSLNVTPEMAEMLLGNGNKLVFGHEHDHRLLFGGNLLVLGNGAPASVADCLGSGFKFASHFDGLDYTLEKMVVIDDVFARLDWRELEAAPEKLFLRVEGSASAQEAADAVSAIAALRQRSSALVIANAVKVEGMAEFDKLMEMSFDQITSFSVLDALLAELEPREQTVVKELLNA